MVGQVRTYKDPSCVYLKSRFNSFSGKWDSTERWPQTNFSGHKLTAVRWQFPKSITTVLNMFKFSKKMCMYTVQPMSIFSILISVVCCILLFLASGGWSSLANMDKILPRSLAFTPSTSDILTDKKSSAKSEHTRHNSIFM